MILLNTVRKTEQLPIFVTKYVLNIVNHGQTGCLGKNTTFAFLSMRNLWY